MCGEEWVFFNAAQVLPCYVIQVFQGRNPKSDQQPVHPPPLAAGLLQEQTNEDEDMPKVEKERQRKAKLLARVRVNLILSFL